jgi:hypothetical protein
MTTSSGSESTPSADSSAEDEFDKTASIPDGSGNDSTSGDEEQDTTSGGAPEDPDN